jgi:pre-mRNA-splicing factor ATP-dependent RNA helicase DHX15/PRP43
VGWTALRAFWICPFKPMLTSERSEWVIYHEFVLTVRNFLRTVTTVKPEW